MSMSQNPDTVAMRLAKRLCPVAIPVSDHAGIVQCVLLKKSLWTTTNVFKFVAGTNRHAFMRAIKPATGRSHVLHAACPARSNVFIRGAQDFARSPVLHAQFQHVSRRVHTASAPCPVPLHATIYRAPFAAKNGFPAATNVHQFVEKCAPQASSARSAPVLRPRNAWSTSFWPRLMPRSTLMRIRVSSLAAAIF